MKKKLIGIAVATFGVALSVGSAIALYTKAAQDVKFGISAGAYAGSTGTINYQINHNSGNSQVAPIYCDAEGQPAENQNDVGVSALYPQIKYEFALNALYSEDLIEQYFVMGKVNVSFSDLAEELNGKVTVYASITGYAEGTVGASMYGTALVDNVVVDAEHPNINIGRDVSIVAKGSQKLEVWVKFADIDEYYYAELDNLYSLNVSWGELSEGFDLAYIVGDSTQWNEDEKYAMVVNASATSFEWMFDGLPGTFGEFKIKCGSNYCHDGENHTLENPEATYVVYWSSGSDIIISAL